MDFVRNDLMPDDTYDTAEGRRSGFNKLVLGCRWDFYFRNFGIFYRSGSCARRDELDAKNQIAYSNMNIDVVEKCGGKIHVRGLEHLRNLNYESVVIIGNHMSLLETALLHAIARQYVDFSFVVKESLLQIPYFGDILKNLDAIGVTRNNPREDFKRVMGKGAEILNRNRSIIIFPQSTRRIDFKPEEFSSIGIKLAKSASKRVLPLALKTDFVKTGKWIRDLGPVNRSQEIYFEFGAPLTVEGNGKEQHNAVIDFIQSRLKAWQK